MHQNNEIYEKYYINSGIHSAKKKWYDRAIEDFRRALKINPDSAIAYYNMGNTYKIMGMYDNAVTAYKQALKYELKIVEVYNNMGVCLAQKGDYNKAIKCWKTGLDINPNYFGLLENLKKVKQS